MRSRPLIFYSHANKTHFPQKGFALILVLKARVLELGNGLLALALAISTLVRCNVILWVAYLFIYLLLLIVIQTHFCYFQTLMNAASEHLSAEFIMSVSIPLGLTTANVNKASIAMDRIVLVRTSKCICSSQLFI